MSNFSTFGQVTGGLEGSAVGIFTASTPDTLTTITTAGYLNDRSAVVKANDKFFINYLDTSTFPLNTGENSIYGSFQVTYDGAGNWSLVQTAADILHARTVMTLAQWLGMYAAPVLLVPAAGSNTIIIPEQIDIGLTYGSAALATGGVVGAQYGATVHGAGPAASTTEAAADFYVTASTMFQLRASLSTGAPFSTTVNTGVYLSNATAAFTVGTGSTFLVDTYYRVVPTV